MTITVVRIPTDTNSPAFVLAAAEARAVAVERGLCILESIEDGDRANLIYLPEQDAWLVDSATLFDPPAWTNKVLRLILRHGATE